jgi:RNA polymerase sigma-70 factor (ECF subfamily)
MYMKNTADTEDMTQNTFLRMISGGVIFESPEHERAWLIRTGVNLCKNSLKSFWNKTIAFDESIDSQLNEFIPDPDETLKKLMSLSPKLKTALYLYYYEGYNTEEIAALMGKPASTIRGYLHRGRSALKNQIETEDIDNAL